MKQSILILLSVLLLLAPAALAQDDIPPELSAEALANATYTGIGSEDMITLTDGRYEGEPFVEGSESRLYVTLIADAVVYGDYTGDGQPEAAVLLTESTGGTGTFYHLALMAAQDGETVNLGTGLLGDRVIVNSIAIEEGAITVNMVQAGPDDAMCCPTQNVISTFRIGLTMVTSEVVTMNLTDAVWLWEQTLMNDGETFIPENPGNYNLAFMEDGRVSIQADCNMVNAAFMVDGNRLTIQPGPSTLVACPEGSLGDVFVSQLTSVGSYFFRDGQLFIELQMDSGTMSFTPQSSTLTGTSWVVTAYNNGQEAVVGTIEATELTATFTEDGTIAGSAGCNNYSASYSIDGDSISIGMALSTMMACAEPEGIMEQEQAFLAALATAATFTWRGDTLEFRTADDALAVMFVAAE